jgi:autotransporter-associated beta strand protein
VGGSFNSGTTFTSLRTANANVLGNNAAFRLEAEAVLDLTNGGASAGFSQAIGSLEGDGEIRLGSATLTVGGRNAEAAYMGIIWGSGNVTKTGSATWVLGNAQQYTGATTINGGTLRLITQGGAYNSPHDHGNLSHSSTINVKSGATLDVSAYNNMSTEFTIGAAGTNLQLLTGGGTVAGDTTIGLLATMDAGVTVAGSLTLAGGSLIDSSGTGSLISTGYNVQSGSIAVNLRGASAALVKSTTGTVTLSGTNDSYGGGTYVLDGSLIVNSSGAIADGTSLTVGDPAPFAPAPAPAVSSEPEPGSVA